MLHHYSKQVSWLFSKSQAFIHRIQFASFATISPVEHNSHGFDLIHDPIMGLPVTIAFGASWASPRMLQC